MTENWKWQLFYGVEAMEKDEAFFSVLPHEIDGVKGEAIEIENGIFSGREPLKEPSERGVLYAEFDLDEETVLPMGFGARYFYRVFLNGKLILDRREEGNKPYSPPRAGNFIVPGFCRKGKNLLAIVLVSVADEVMYLDFKILKDHPWQKSLPTIENYSALLESVKYPREGSSERESALRLIQNGVLMMRNTVFNPFVADTTMDESKLAELEEKYPILYFYEKALDRIIKEIQESAPGKDEICMWLLYNMGYVIKSSAGTFGLDLNHRRAALLAPFIDFVLTTHNHVDHCDIPLFKELTAQGKKVITNFYPAPGFHRPPAELDLNGIKIITQENDHNPTLRKFVTSYYITLPEGCTIFATGDSRDVTQLNPPGEVDIFIPHPRVGLKVPEAVEKFRPKSVLYSHMLELRHTPPTPWYAVPYTLLKDEMAQVSGTGCTALAPCWGEKLVWNTVTKSFV